MSSEIGEAHTLALDSVDASAGTEMASSGPRSRTEDGASLEPGRMLDDTYKVVRILGRGAMGAVYLVEHTALGKQFAAKVVTESRALDKDAVTRLRNEARITSALDHDNIVNVTHLGTTKDGMLFIVMELLEGQTLRERIEGCAEAAATSGESEWLPDDETREVISQILSGLTAAHESGIVHRDLKPDNIFLAERRGVVRAKIVDFGISKIQRNSVMDSDQSLTRTGDIIGTPLYMSPEQSRDTKQVDGRADLYSVGVIAYEMATSRAPFVASTLYELIVKHATESPEPIEDHRSNLPVAVRRVIERGLEKDPEDRFASAEEMRAAWEDAWSAPPDEVAAEPTERAAPVEVHGREDLLATAREPAPVTAPADVVHAPASPARWIALAGIVVLLVAGGAWWAGQSTPDPVGVDRTPSAEEAEPPVDELLAVGERTPPHEETVGEREPAVPEGVDAPEVVAAVVEREIQSDPSGARVFLGGEEVGTTPHRLQLEPGASLEIELRRRGYESRRLQVSEDDPPVVEVDLVRHRGRVQPSLAPI